MRLADFLVDHGPQGYGKPLAYLIEKLAQCSDNMDEAKQLYNANSGLVDKFLSEFMVKRLTEHKIEQIFDEIPDTFAPLTPSSISMHYLELPKAVQIHYIDSDEKLSLFDNLGPSP